MILACTDAAEAFFAKTPTLKPTNGEVPAGSFVVTIAIVGAEFTTGAPATQPLSVSFLKQPTAITLRAIIPPPQ